MLQAGFFVSLTVGVNVIIASYVTTEKSCRINLILYCDHLIAIIG